MIAHMSFARETIRNILHEDLQITNEKNATKTLTHEDPQNMKNIYSHIMERFKTNPELLEKAIRYHET